MIIPNASPLLYNEDLAPATERKWGAFSIFNVWTSDVHSLWGYYLAASLFLLCGNFLNFIIAIGLGIGAMFVRSLTIMLVERETLACYRYLEHGAFYAIIALALMMFLSTVQHIPEVVTGLIGAAFIVTAFFDSLRYNRRAAAAASIADPVKSNGEILIVQNLQEPSVGRLREPRATSRPE